MDAMESQAKFEIFPIFERKRGEDFPFPGGRREWFTPLGMLYIHTIYI